MLPGTLTENPKALSPVTKQSPIGGVEKQVGTAYPFPTASQLPGDGWGQGRRSAEEIPWQHSDILYLPSEGCRQGIRAKRELYRYRKL